MSDDGTKQRIEINWAQTVAAPLAAVTSAVLLSTVGVAGTIIGAALGSLAYTLGSSIYSHYITATKERVAQAQKVTAAKIDRAQQRVRGASENLDSGAEDPGEELERAGEELHQARSALEDADEGAPIRWRGLVEGLPWKHIAVVAGGVFLVAMAVIVVFELVTGRAVSSYTGGSDPDRRTSIPFIGRAAPADRSEPSEQATPDDTARGTSSREDERDPAPEREEAPDPVPEASPTSEPTETATPSPLSEPTATETTPTPTESTATEPGDATP